MDSEETILVVTMLNKVDLDYYDKGIRLLREHSDFEVENINEGNLSDKLLELIDEKKSKYVIIISHGNDQLDIGTEELVLELDDTEKLVNNKKQILEILREKGVEKLMLLACCAQQVTHLGHLRPIPEVYTIKSGGYLSYNEFVKICSKLSKNPYDWSFLKDITDEAGDKKYEEDKEKIIEYVNSEIERRRLYEFNHHYGLK